MVIEFLEIGIVILFVVHLQLKSQIESAEYEIINI